MRRACQWLAVAVLTAGCGGATVGRDTPRAKGDSASLAAAGRAATEARPGRMTAAEARVFLASHPEALVLDVRNPDEWDNRYGHIEGARQIPLPELSARVAEIEGWKDQPIVLVCQSGGRSQTGAELLASLGYRQVFNLAGGMIAWRATEKRRP